jgi:hypothetical protein
MRISSILSITAVLSACTYEETELKHHDFTGTVKIPKEALTLTIMDEDNNEIVVENDPRTIGPVYIGAFASIRDDLYSYPHPEIGPVLDEDLPGNTYPYSGTTVGRFDWACYEELRCKMVTGRYESYQDILDFFRDEIGQPVLNENGEEVSSNLEYRERCYEIMMLTSDDELSFVDPEGLDFTEDGDYWVAEVDLLHTYFEQDEDGNGPQVWGWVDMPSRTYNFASCDKEAGQNHFYYDEFYNTGTNHLDVLNYPGLYIDEGDYVAEDGPRLNSVDDTFELVLGVRNDD